jgi:hypothetical protein
MVYSKIVNAMGTISGYDEWVTCVMGCKVKTYKRKYDKYKYYATAWTGSTKEYIDGKAGGKIYVEMYKHSNRLYVWFRNTLAESIKASIDEKGGSNMYVGIAALGKNIEVDKRYHRSGGQTAGDIKVRIEAYECIGRGGKHVKGSSVNSFSVSDKMEQDGDGNNLEMVTNVPQQAASTGEYYLVKVPRYTLSTSIAMLLLSVTVCAYKPCIPSNLTICSFLLVCLMPSYRICVNRIMNILMDFTNNMYECMLSNVYVSLRNISNNTLGREYKGGNWYSRYRE